MISQESLKIRRVTLYPPGGRCSAWQPPQPYQKNSRIKNYCNFMNWYRLKNQKAIYTMTSKMNMGKTKELQREHKIECCIISMTKLGPREKLRKSTFLCRGGGLWVPYITSIVRHNRHVNWFCSFPLFLSFLKNSFSHMGSLGKGDGMAIFGNKDVTQKPSIEMNSF